MQAPTCTNVRIRSTQDAHKIFYAVRRRELTMVNRRLDADERLALRSGCVYAWEERGPHTEITGLGIERFTEGRRWSPSRVRDEFLFYYEKYTPPQDGSQTSPSGKQPPRDWDPLVKQTYSVWVETEKGRRKWHLTAYFTQATVDQLGTIDDIPGVGDLAVPSGLFQSTRVGKTRKSDDSHRGASRDTCKPATTSAMTRTFAPFSPTYSSSHSKSPVPGSPKLFDPYPSTNYGNGPSCFSGTQLLQFSVPPLPVAQRPLSASHNSQPSGSDTRDRTIPPATIEYPHFGRNDLFSRQSTLGHRADASYRPSSETAGVEVSKPSDSNTGLSFSPPVLRSIDLNETPVTSPLYSPNTHASNGSETSLSPTSSTAWFAYPPTLQPCSDHHPTSFSDRDGVVTPFPLRTSFTTLTQSAPPTAHSDSHLFHQQSTSQTPSHSYTHTQPRSPQNNSPPSPQRSLGSPISHLSLPSIDPRSFESHSTEWCGFESDRKGTIGPTRVDLTPLHALERNRPYPRHPVDDQTLRLLRPRSS